MSVRAFLARLACALLAAAALAGAAPAAEMTDAVGRRVTVPAKPRRVVSLAPNITEMLFALGAGEQVAGVTDYCDYPPEAAGLPRVGGFVNPSLETVLALRPDLVIATADGNRPADVLQLERLGLPVFVIDTRSMSEVLAAVRTIGTLVGRESEAADLAAALAAGHSRVLEAAASGPAPRAVFLVGWSPMVAAGPGTFIDSLMKDAGATNALAGSPVRYPLLGLESLLALDPDVIIVNAADARGDISWPPGWERLRAARTGAVRRLEDDRVLRPGPRIVEGLELMVEMLRSTEGGSGP